MKTYIDCYPCFLRQAIESAKLSGSGARTQKKIIDDIVKSLPNIPLSFSPPEIGINIRLSVRKFTGNKDPYKKIKDKSNKLALGIYGLLKHKVANSSDRFLTAVELAVAGNIIDYGVKNNLNIEDEISKILKKEYKAIKHEDRAVFDYEVFIKVLKNAKTILYLADNAGETVFDRILIEEIKRFDKSKKIIYAVKERPTINDALIEDALVSGVGESAEIISCGAATSGTILKYCSKSFLKLFKAANMVISKGQGNFEALSNAKREIFFLLKAKCPVVVRHLVSLKVPCVLGDIVLYYRKRNKTR